MQGLEQIAYLCGIRQGKVKITAQVSQMASTSGIGSFFTKIIRELQVSCQRRTSPSCPDGGVGLTSLAWAQFRSVPRIPKFACEPPQWSRGTGEGPA